MPGTVSEVSATLVASTTRRPWDRENTRSWSAADSREYKEMRLAQEVRRIDWQETVGEFGALLLESRLVKQIQPVHNYFILAAAELGVPGMLILIWIFISHAWVLIKNYFTAHKMPLASILICFLVLMQFDHYFYTLQQTQMLLWIFLGITSAQLKTPQEGERVL